MKMLNRNLTLCACANLTSFVLLLGISTLATPVQAGQHNVSNPTPQPQCSIFDQNEGNLCTANTSVSSSSGAESTHSMAAEGSDLGSSLVEKAIAAVLELIGE